MSAHDGPGTGLDGREIAMNKTEDPASKTTHFGGRSVFNYLHIVKIHTDKCHKIKAGKI